MCPLSLQEFCKSTISLVELVSQAKCVACGMQQAAGSHMSPLSDINTRNLTSTIFFFAKLLVYIVLWKMKI